jgi:CheY-like chemotaxis protein
MAPSYTGADNIDIIIADDEDDNLDVAEMGLALAGFDEGKLVKVTSGDDAIDKVKELQSGDPDIPLVVLLDLNMPPGKSGSECAIILDAIEGYERPPMLVCCSAGKVSDIKAQSYAKHFAHFISKPFTPALAEALKTAIEEWVQSKQ